MIHRAWGALNILTYTETNWSFADGASSLTEEEMRGGDSEERMDMLWEDFNMEETKERIKLAQLDGFGVTRRNVSKGRVSTKRASSVVRLLKKKLHSIRQKSDRQFRKKDH
ncbi:hypothetical protein Droror1_Dr00001737 [Drosera rotundifolia]